MKRILLLLACAGWLMAGPAQAELSDPGQIQTEAYIQLVQADQSLDAGRLDEALRQYQAARDYYVRLAREFPGWEPRVIQYRKTYCDNQIADIQRQQAGGSPREEWPELEPLPGEAPAAAPPAVAVAPEEPAPVADRSVEINYLKSRIASLEEELRTRDSQQAEYDTLAAQYKQCRQELANANQQVQNEKNAGQSALAALQAEADKKDEQLRDLRKELKSKKQLDQALNDLEAKVNELQAQNQRLDDEIQALNRELDDAEIRADQAELKLQQAEASLKAANKALEKAEKAAQARVQKDEPAPAKTQEAAAAKPSRKPAVADVPMPPVAPEKAPPAEQPAPPALPPPVKVTSTAAPREVPAGMNAADFVRQLLQEGQNDAALATVLVARQSHPADMNLVLIEGITLIRLQRYSDAAILLVDLARNNPRNAEINATLGAAMMGAGFYEEARESLLAAIRLDKHLPECLYNLAQLYALVDPKDLKQARKYYKQALALGVMPDAQLEAILQ
ncbi:MAG TPA: hypothetical protein PLT37_00715 [Kiritimatiellia bacterium]|nr:hypothetical protein [Kiritimatiellia bacterium]MBP9572243.1 hypothetical protein [Kiritimatiellia bacterium]HQF19746.1 hypothetical protein [Kiritimatiellia bacterium]HQG75196.1 hypothetical protein [Kiritimatiellia bacterium]HXK80012.1 hypothetical protein [Kiritimatiellia bacterium]